MTTVFIGGSRAVSRLNATIVRRLDIWSTRNADIHRRCQTARTRLFSSTLPNAIYPNVTVFCVARVGTMSETGKFGRSIHSSQKRFGILRLQGHRDGSGSDVRGDVLGR